MKALGDHTWKSSSTFQSIPQSLFEKCNINRVINTCVFRIQDAGLCIVKKSNLNSRTATLILLQKKRTKKKKNYFTVDCTWYIAYDIGRRSIFSENGSTTFELVYKAKRLVCLCDLYNAFIFLSFRKVAINKQSI